MVNFWRGGFKVFRDSSCVFYFTMLIGPPAVAYLYPPFVLLFGRFLEIASLVFSKFLDGARNPYEMVCDSQIF